MCAGLALALAIGLPVPGASAQSTSDYRALTNQVDQLQRSVNDLKRAVATGSPPATGGAEQDFTAPPQSVADIQVKLTNLQEQVRQLNGRIEEMEHEIRQTNDKLTRFQEDAEFRFQELEGGGSATSKSSIKPAAPEQEAKPDETPSAGASDSAASADGTLPKGDAQSQYSYAFNLLKNGDFDQSRTAFLDFLSLNPDSSLAGNAQYWLGETYYAQGDYKNAADAFLTGYTDYGTGPKAPDSLLKLGMSLASLGQKDAACTTLAEVSKKYPDAATNLLQRASQEMSKAEC